jgi:hypothetical protein
VVEAKKHVKNQVNKGAKILSDFKEFMNEVEESPVKALLASNAKPPEIHLALKAAVGKLLAPTSLSVSEQQKVSEEVSNLVKDKAFLSEFSDQIGEPLEKKDHLPPR